jgi:hypothetical protein
VVEGNDSQGHPIILPLKCRHRIGQLREDPF